MANRPIEELVELIAEFPGIGPRQARRIVQFLLSKNGGYRELLAKRIASIAKSTQQCARCFRFDDVNARGLCRLCADEGRDQSTLMAVEKDVDVESIEASGVYAGNYFVLGGLLSMTLRKNGQTVRDRELIARVEKNGITEIIFALSTTPEGDYTARELAKKMNAASPKTKTTLLGRGLSVGAEIEYADSETLRSAFKNRS